MGLQHLGGLICQTNPQSEGLNGGPTVCPALCWGLQGLLKRRHDLGPPGFSRDQKGKLHTQQPHVQADGITVNAWLCDLGN